MAGSSTALMVGAWVSGVSFLQDEIKTEAHTQSAPNNMVLEFIVFELKM
jgi:hypothetical protein